MTYEEERNVEVAVSDYMRANDMYPEVFTQHTPIDNAVIVKAEIRWGDWKHDHLRYGYLLSEWAKANGFRVIVEDHVEQVTEEDGSDCYSGIHKCSLYKA